MLAPEYLASVLIMVLSPSELFKGTAPVLQLPLPLSLYTESQLR